ncbi:putative sensor-like histidine kinase [Paenibacillus konkukensis]|uniref:Sensor-like histidine kinase n=1 Tax=Paenibacillus konkukensis TaxID=2020716 RepID=A0ABY4RKS5_9BACL|nr:sensor histidine kinase [Paenibacillus konkukensis]UQZ82451.1 putative sensor-like histidine kinase [Paenibacillus konkukensis]
MNLLMLKFSSIRAKFILLFTFFFLLPFILFGSMWYHRSTQVIEDNAVASAQKSIQQTDRYLNYYFNDLERSTLPYITHPLIEAFMKLSPDDEYQRYIITAQIQNQVIDQVIYGKKEIYGFSIYSDSGMSVSNLSSTMDYWKNRDIVKLEPKDVRTVSYNSVHWENQSPILTISRAFTVKNTKGLLLIDLRIKDISALISSVGSSQTGLTWIANAEDTIVLHPDQSLIGGPVPDWYYEHIKNQEQGSLIVEDSGVKKLVVFERSPLTEWTLISEVPLAELTGDLFSLRNVTIIVFMAVSLIALLVVGGFSLRLTNALSNMRRLMKRAGSGEMFVRAHVAQGKQDELYELYESFNQMVEQLQRLINEVHASELREKELVIKQRETMLKSMQAQINPHFLYNTLEVINSYAILENMMPISRMATSLAALFRYSITSGSEEVSLDEEMAHIQTYLDIQKERFEELTVEFQFNRADLRHIQTLRLTIQPLVENAFRHGYDKHERYPEFIGISGEPAPEGYRLLIMDKGAGWSPM